MSASSVFLAFGIVVPTPETGRPRLRSCAIRCGDRGRAGSLQPVRFVAAAPWRALRELRLMAKIAIDEVVRGREDSYFARLGAGRGNAARRSAR